ncbi:MAG TPA: TonB family protein [Deltaproteobacteria bacterium]|nr:TonB family protein [Deltaproteobacteria bacterium]
MKAKFLTSLALSAGLHIFFLAPIFLLGAPTPPPEPETINVSLVESAPRVAREVTRKEPTEITRNKPPEQRIRDPFPRRTRQPEREPQPPEETPPPEGVTFETEGKVNIGYMQRLKAKIFRAWQYPEQAIVSGHQGQVKLAFVVDEEGHLIGVDLLEGSGYRELDLAAQQAIKDASPFGRFPPDIQEKTLKIKGRFRYVID